MMLLLSYFLFLCFLDNVLYLLFPRLRAKKLKRQQNIKGKLLYLRQHRSSHRLIFFLMVIIQPEATSYFCLGLEFNTGEDSSASTPEIFVRGALA